MKKIILPIVLMSCAAVMPVCSADPVKISFERDGYIWTTISNGDKSARICKGCDSDISPDGNKLVFTYDTSKGYASINRKIAVVDLNSGKINILTSIPDNNSYGPIWSPDGKQIAFMHRTNDGWDVGIVNSDGDNFHLLTHGTGNSWNMFSSPAWSPDGKYILFHDMEYLYKINLEGEISMAEKIKDILDFSTYSICDGTRFLLSKDERYLLIDPPDVSRFGMKGLTGPVYALVVYDRKTKIAAKISPDNLYAHRPDWVNEREIIFEGTTEEDFARMGEWRAPSNIYKISIDGKDLKLLIKNGGSPSCSK
ncbi:MAG: hypothetical protein CVU77_05780 [Elusimicrobia bacterium HGW-Elusimicrobia-1]|nr:MAG: hypothetical protein CVU77_05780 [Elusimicrobia bacterium HGW-Elusimicrobia-1]